MACQSSQTTTAHARYHDEFYRSTSNRVICLIDESNHARVSCEKPAKFGLAIGPRRLGMKGVADRLKQAPPLPHMRYHAKIGRCCLKSVVLDGGEPQNWGALGLRPLGWERC